MKAFHYLVLGYAVIWAALGLYLYTLGRRLRQMHGEVEELKRRLREGEHD